MNKLQNSKGISFFVEVVCHAELVEVYFRTLRQAQGANPIVLQFTLIYEKLLEQDNLLHLQYDVNYYLRNNFSISSLALVVREKSKVSARKLKISSLTNCGGLGPR